MTHVAGVGSIATHTPSRTARSTLSPDSAPSFLWDAEHDTAGARHAVTDTGEDLQIEAEAPLQ